MPDAGTSHAQPSELPRHVLRDARADGTETLLLRAPLVVAVSGGADSVALLHVLCHLRNADAAGTLLVAHLHHGIRGPDADDDARFVEDFARALGLCAVIEYADVPAFAREHRLSLEEAARNLRYSFLNGLAAAESAAVAVAHTADDQAETVLLRVLRGAGLTGLAAMRPVSRVPVAASSAAEPATLFRPLLGVWRREIEEYLAALDSQFRIDSTNLDTGILRNRVRHQLLPLLERDFNPRSREHLWSLARAVAEDDVLLNEMVDALWGTLALPDTGCSAVTIDTDRFRELHPAIRLRLIRRAATHLGGATYHPTWAHTRAAERLLSSEAEGSLQLPGGIIAERREGWAGLRHPSSPTPAVVALTRFAKLWPLMRPGGVRVLVPGERVELAHGWVCDVDEVDPKGHRPGELMALFGAHSLGTRRIYIRPRVRGDRINQLGMVGSRSLKELYVDAKIPQVVRGRLPIVAHGDTNEVLWVPGPGGRRSSLAPIRPNTRRALRVSFSRLPASTAEPQEG